MRGFAQPQGAQQFVGFGRWLCRGGCEPVGDRVPSEFQDLFAGVGRTVGVAERVGVRVGARWCCGGVTDGLSSDVGGLGRVVGGVPKDRSELTVAESVEQVGGVAEGCPLLGPGAGAFPVVDQFGVSVECLVELPVGRVERNETDGGDSVDEPGVGGEAELDCSAVVLLAVFHDPASASISAAT